MINLAINRWINDFEFTVTGVGERLADEPAVTGVRCTETSRIRVPLPADVADRLGLPLNVAYEIDGTLYDVETGQPVRLPVDQTLTVPARWLHRLP